MQGQHNCDEANSLEKGNKIADSIVFEPDDALFSFYNSQIQQRKNQDSYSDDSIQNYAINSKNIPREFESPSFKTLAQQLSMEMNLPQINQIPQNKNNTTEHSLPELNSSIDLGMISMLHQGNNQNNIFEVTSSKILQSEDNNNSNILTNGSDDARQTTPVKDNEIEEDLNMLKKSINQGKKKQQKKVSMFNKTLCHTAFKNLNQNDANDKQIYEDQIKMLLKMAASKRKQSYTLLKQWEIKHIQKMDFHQNMVQIFLIEIDKRLRSSMENLQIYSIFFTERAKQQEKYSQSPIINTANALENNYLSKTTYSNFTSVINNLNSFNEQKCKKIKDFVHLINQNILIDLIQDHSTQSQKQLIKIRQKISTLKTTLKKCTEQVLLTHESINKCYNQTMEGPQKDLYSKQLKLIRRVIRQAIIQKQLGQLSLQYYKMAINQDIKRSQVIKEALVTYSKGLNQTYNIDIQKQQIQQMSKGQQSKLILQLYSFEEMFQNGHIKLLRTMAKLPKQHVIQFQDFEKYIKNFTISKFQIRMSILKKYSTKILSKDSKQQTSCQIIITVDNFLQIFKDREKKQDYADADIMVGISKKQLQVKIIDNQCVQIIKKQQKRASMISYFWDSKIIESHKIKFAKRDDKEQFLDTIKKLTK